MKKKLIINLITVVIGVAIFFYTKEFGWNLDGVKGIGLILLMFLFTIFYFWTMKNR